ncbi:MULTISPECIES: GtrA family protein [Streptococcus]|jgi:putative flippase GtrA|uniref:GtrA family protein n=1 Tax=Streptococcus TaxID=1301 RepID=UPI0008EF4960|nr:MULTISPECIES: GtrA family protein [Streptococcus]MBK8155896.1 GtrA family protein [Streptococcus sp.]MBT0895977.1 GtrA family protein [Streptococcus infantarius subsp. infantarius]MBT0900185.1 GtrA family protein [Streptococcus infantarius subsp. infantarius]MBT1033822.1 GtrA family protein [Streptococcus infantarius subsp. infantarius]MCO4464770.1 putative membrane protein [Streptococcus infantarius subsp. infantarius]
MKKLITSEVFKYLFFGVLTTLVYMGTRLVIFSLTSSATFSAVIANIVAILFAFFTNDYFVFNQVRKGWFERLVKFTIARLSTLILDLALAFFLVTKFPHIIGQFVNDNLSMVNAIETLFSQVLIIVLNYVLSKLLVFKDKK